MSTRPIDGMSGDRGDMDATRVRRTPRGPRLVRDLWRAMAHPRRAWNRLNRWRLLARYAEVPHADVARYRRELDADSTFRRHLARYGGEVGYVTCGPQLYVVVRATKPETVVETGVASGISSAYILQALAVNGGGLLHSIDLPNVQDGSKLPAGRASGWIVPDALRSRWHLQLGDTRRLLPALLETLGRLDLFFHDSDHSYETMRFELSLAVRHLADGALLMSDDTHLHRAWDEVCARHTMPAGRVGRVGVTRRWRRQ